jgi:16S rRNA (cytosine967-C5)-methyltransferase
MLVSVRSVACDALVRIEAGAYAHVVLPPLLRRSGLPSRDRAQVTDLVYGTVRAQRRIDDLLERVSRRRLRALDPPVRAAMRVGAQQLLEGVPAHAAVGETVAAAPGRARGYVNATLRALARLGPPFPEPSDEAVALSYPDWIVDRLRAELGESDARAVLVAGNQPGTLTLRPNPARADAAGLRAELEAAGARVEPGRLVPGALIVRGAGDPATLRAISEGRATPQDQASQAVVAFLAPRPGDTVLDAAAAPGGKATAIAEQVRDSGLVVAADVAPGRLRLVRHAAARLGLAVTTVVADARQPPWRAGVFDRVLVDAPCSGLGVLRRRPDARWRMTPGRIDELAEMQRAMVLAAAATVRPGGVLVYAVCTLTGRETVDVARHVVERLHGWSVLEPPGPPWRPHGPGALLLPPAADTDGMFVLGLARGAG